jgi:anti-sigma B factor antagonist
MEVIKETIEEGKIIKVDIGTEYNKESSEMLGSVELDIENQSQFVEIINSIFEEGSSRILVNMANITYIDSSGLWALFEGHKKAAQKNTKMVLLSPTKDVRRVLDITKMSSKMEIFDTEKEAIKKLLA